MIITNENDMYIFFELIRRLEAVSVLDVGMFLKRIGSVSRSLKNAALPEMLEIDGIDIYSGINFPVWKTVYSHIINVENFLDEELVKSYDLMIVLGVEEIAEKINLDKLVDKVEKHVKYIFLNKSPNVLLQKKVSENHIKTIQLEEDTYYLWSVGE